MSESVMIHGRCLASFIGHTILKPEAQGSEGVRLCEESIRFRFASGCVNPCFVPIVANSLQGTGILTCSVVEFPLGARATECKAHEAEICIKNGLAHRRRRYRDHRELGVVPVGLS